MVVTGCKEEETKRDNNKKEVKKITIERCTRKIDEFGG